MGWIRPEKKEQVEAPSPVEQQPKVAAVHAEPKAAAAAAQVPQPKVAAVPAAVKSQVYPSPIPEPSPSHGANVVALTPEALAAHTAKAGPAAVQPAATQYSRRQLPI